MLYERLATTDLQCVYKFKINVRNQEEYPQADDITHE